MSITALTTFIEITDSAGRVRGRYQNSDGTIRYGSANYSYLSFFYQGAAKSRTGDNLQAALVMSNNALSSGIAVQAINGRYRVRCDTCLMNPQTFAFVRRLTRECWIASTMSYDDTNVEIVLSSGIDAVGANAPTRTLTAESAGPLPVTGAIQNI